MNISQRILSWAIRSAGLLAAVLVFLPAESSARVFFQSAPVIPVPNLVGYWCVDGPVPDTSTIAKDSSGSGNHGTYVSGATAMATAPTVPAGNLKSFSFNQASRQYISVPDSPSLSITGSMTVAAWVKASDTTLQQGIVEKWDEPSVTGGYSFRLDASENLSFAICNASGANGVSTAPRTIPLNTWAHVAGVYANAGASGTITNYVNAVADASVGTGIAPPTDGSYALQIGDDHGSNAFNGNVDEVRIYNRALTANEVAILKNGQPAPMGLVAASGTNQNVLTWTAASNAAAVTVTYSVLSGPSTGNYTSVVNGITGTTYTDTNPGGSPVFYSVVAVSVMASSPSNESAATATVGPPPPPPAPRAPKTGGGEKHNLCGGSTASPDSVPLTVLGSLLAAVLLLVLTRNPRV
jgi:hypothetical protein